MLNAAKHPLLLWQSYLQAVGGLIFRFFRVLRELGAFAVITLGVALTKRRVAPQVIRPLILQQLWHSGVRLLPMIGFLAFVLGLVIIGQTVVLLTSVGAQEYLGTVMVTTLVRELGPLLTALVVLARSGAATAVELGTARALGEVEALEALGIDPVHYLVVPRVLALGVAVFCLTTYAILIAVASGYLFAFLTDVPLRPSVYLAQLGDALRWQDFPLLALKTLAFGAVIAVVNCYHGLARRLSIEEVSQVTSSAVVHSVVGCVLIDALFLVGYLFL